jgi:hypothetical protein
MRRLIGLSLIMLLFAMPAFAVHGKYTIERIDNAYNEGEINYDQYITYKFFAGLYGNLLPEIYNGEALAETPMCGTFFIELVYNAWYELKPETKMLLSQYLPSNPDDANAKGLEGTYGWYDARFNKYAYGWFVDPFKGTPYSYESPNKHFMLWWADFGPHSTNEAWVKNTADWLDYAYDVTVNQYKWFADAADTWDPYFDYYAPDDPNNPIYDPDPAKQKPFGPDQYNLYPSYHWDIMIGNLQIWSGQAGLLGVTFPMYYDNPQTPRYEGPAYMALWNHTYPGGSDYPADETAAHEWMHIVEYGGYECNYAHGGFVEMTSVWAQDLVYPNYNHYVSTRVNGYLHVPQVWLWSTEQTYAYEHTLWAFFLDDFFNKEYNHGYSDSFRRVYKADSKGDAWFKNDSKIDRDEETAPGFLYALDQNLNKLTDPEDNTLFQQQFQELFTTFCGWNWFTGSRDDSQHYHDGALYTTVHYIQEYTSTDLPVVEKELAETEWPDSLASNYVHISSFPSGWNDATIKFISFEKEDFKNWEGSREWDGWVFVKKGGVWTPYRMNCPWDNGILAINLSGVEDVGVCILNKCLTYYHQVPYKISIINKDESNPPSVTLNPVIWSWQPEILSLMITANEKTHGVPDLRIKFTPEGGKEETTRILCEQPDLSQPLFYASYTEGYGISGSGTVDIDAFDVYGNKGSVSYDFALSNTPPGGMLSLETENVSLYAPPGVKDFKGMVAFIEDTVSKNNVNVNQLDNSSTNMDIPTIAKKVGGSVEELSMGVIKTGSDALLGPAVRIFPTWGTLKGEARLTMSYNGIDVTDETKVSIYKQNGDGSWTEVGGIVNPKNNTVTANITSFGVYAIGLGNGSKVGEGSQTPPSFTLAQNYPNPFSDNTVIKFEIGKTTDVSLKVYNIAGQLVSTIFEGTKEPGVYTINWNGTNNAGERLTNGVYLYTLQAGSDFKATKKMLLVR